MPFALVFLVKYMYVTYSIEWHYAQSNRTVLAVLTKYTNSPKDSSSSIGVNTKIVQISHFMNRTHVVDMRNMSKIASVNTF